eukprot:8915639-Alexandrium_andersonii.AAC.1
MVVGTRSALADGDCKPAVASAFCCSSALAFAAASARSSSFRSASLTLSQSLVMWRSTCWRAR